MAIQTVANVLLITTPGCHKALFGLFAAFAPRLKTRGVVQRAVRPCSVSLRGAGLVSIDVCDPMPGLPVGRCVVLRQGPKQHLPSEEDSCRKHVGTHCVPAVVDF